MAPNRRVQIFVFSGRQSGNGAGSVGFSAGCTDAVFTASQWVEEGVAPDKLIATTDQPRRPPLCCCRTPTGGALLRVDPPVRSSTPEWPQSTHSRRALP